MIFSGLLGPTTTRSLIPGGDFSFVLFYNFNNVIGKQNADFKENLLLGQKVAPGVGSVLKSITLHVFPFFVSFAIFYHICNHKT